MGALSLGLGLRVIRGLWQETAATLHCVSSARRALFGAAGLPAILLHSRQRYAAGTPTEK